MRRWAEFLTWFGLLGAGLIWVVQLVVGFGVTVAACSAAGRVWGIDVDAWEIGLMTVGVVVVFLAEAAAVSIFM